jgi:SET domain-containing protein
MNRSSIIFCIIIFSLIAYILKHKCDIDNMTNTYVSPFDKLYIKPSPFGGKGVFASRDIKKGEVLEYSPYIEDTLDKFTGVVRDYVFNKPTDSSDRRAILVFGYSSMYNHADVPSADWNIENDGMKITANKNINKDDEIFISYGSNYWNTRNLEKKIPK